MDQSERTNLTRLIDRAKLALGMDLKTRDERLRELTAELERLGFSEYVSLPRLDRPD